MSTTEAGSTARVTRIVELVAASPALTLTEIVARAGLPQTTVHRVLAQLVTTGWVVVDRKRRYRLSAQLYSIAASGVEGLDLQETALDHLKELAAATGETVHLAVLDDHWVVFISRVGSEHPLSMRTPAGTRQPAEKMAVGRTILAFTSDADIPRNVRDRLTSDQQEEFDKRLSAIRSRGYEVDDEEFVVGARGVAVPVFGRHGVVGAISVVGPSIRLTREETVKVAALCKETARLISTEFGSQLRMGA